jgi:hypothetical protein
MRSCRRLTGKLLAGERDESSPACVCEIAEVADANEAPGQHMLAEAAQELACGERHDALLVAMCVVFAMRPPEEDWPINILEGAVRSGKTWCLHPKALYCCGYEVGGRKLFTGVSKQSVYILTILSWRIFWITMLNRTRPDAAPTEAFTNLDQYLLDELVPNKGSPPPVLSLGHYIVKLARLGGYLARAHDPPPGNTVIWRGMSRLTDIELGIMIGAQLVGN